MVPKQPPGPLHTKLFAFERAAARGYVREALCGCWAVCSCRNRLPKRDQGGWLGASEGRPNAARGQSS